MKNPGYLVAAGVQLFITP